jgi:hypothetical protein
LFDSHLGLWHSLRMTEQEMKMIIKETLADREELKPYFDQVCSKTDWKARIDAICRREDLVKVSKAIEFFTATEASFVEMCPPSIDWLRVQSIGYRAGPAGDH